MSTNFYTAMLSFSISMLGCLLYKRQKQGEMEIERQRFMLDANVLVAIRPTRELAVLSTVLLVLCLFLNLLWW
jgi:hypothetical protein